MSVIHYLQWDDYPQIGDYLQIVDYLQVGGYPQVISIRQLVIIFLSLSVNYQGPDERPNVLLPCFIYLWKYHLKHVCQEQAKTTGCFSSIGKPLFPFAVNFFFSPVLVGCRMVIALFWEPPVCVAGVDAFWDWEWRNWSILVTQWGSRQSSCLPLQWSKDRKNWAILLRRSSWLGEWFFSELISLRWKSSDRKGLSDPLGCNCGVREYLWIILRQYFAGDHGYNHKLLERLEIFLMATICNCPRFQGQGGRWRGLPFIWERLMTMSNC